MRWFWFTSDWVLIRSRPCRHFSGSTAHLCACASHDAAIRKWPGMVGLKDFVGFWVSRTPSPSKRPRDSFCGGVYLFFGWKNVEFTLAHPRFANILGMILMGGSSYGDLNDDMMGTGESIDRRFQKSYSHIKFWISSPKIMKTNCVCGISMLCKISTFSSCGFQVPTFNMDLGMSLVPIKRLLSAWLLHLWRAKQVNTQCEKNCLRPAVLILWTPFFMGQILTKPMENSPKTGWFCHGYVAPGDFDRVVLAHRLLYWAGWVSWWKNAWRQARRQAQDVGQKKNFGKGSKFMGIDNIILICSMIYIYNVVWYKYYLIVYNII